jgi:putative selenium metabolism protein SsnA
MASLLIANGTVVTLGEPLRVLPHHDVLCTDGLIARIAPHGGIAGRFNETIDARGAVVMPGFINIHTHIYSALVRGLGKAEPAADFQQVLERLWWRLDRQLRLEDVESSAYVTLIEAIRHGATTIFDHHASPFAVCGSLDVIAAAVKRVGLRACLCYEVSDRDGGEIAQAGIAENAAFIARLAAEPDPHLRALFGLHAAFTLSDATLTRAVEAAHGAGFHVHVAEAASDQEVNLARSGMRVVERLHRFGVLSPKTIAAHCVHVNEAELELLAATDTAVAHNPQSNMNNAVGVADVAALRRKGVLVGLGTDAMTTNMLEELRAALFVRHLAARNPSAGFGETVALLAHGNAAIANRHWEPKLGELREGWAADIAMLPYDPPTPLDESTFYGHLVFGLSQAHVATTIVGGRVLMRDGRLTLDLDEAEINAKARARAAALWERF